MDSPNQDHSIAGFTRILADPLEALWQEYHSKGSTYRQHRQRVFKASYTHHYRSGLIQIIEALEFGSTNTVHAPMMTALALIKRYRAEHTHHTKYYTPGESVPVEGIVPGELAELMYRTDTGGRRRILRSVYECGVFQTLRDKLRCKEIWVVGAYKWRNPDLDLPKDFDEKRAENYTALRKPLDARKFTAELIEEMDYELSALNNALPNLPWLRIVERKKESETFWGRQAGGSSAAPRRSGSRPAVRPPQLKIR